MSSSITYNACDFNFEVSRLLFTPPDIIFKTSTIDGIQEARYDTLLDTHDSPLGTLNWSNDSEDTLLEPREQNGLVSFGICGDNHLLKDNCPKQQESHFSNTTSDELAPFKITQGVRASFFKAPNMKKRLQFESTREDNPQEQKSQDLVLTKKHSKLIKIQKKAAFTSRLYQLIDEQQNYLFHGDFFVCKDVYQVAQGDRSSSNLCPINYFRPPTQVIKGANYCLAKLDDSYHGQNDINSAYSMLLRLQSKEAKYIADFLFSSYKKQLEGKTAFRAKVLAYYNNSEQRIQEIIAANHEISLKKAFAIIDKLDPSKVFALHYKKVDAFTLAHKQLLVGGNKAFCSLFMGSDNIDMLSQFMSRFGLPHYMDYKAIQEILIVILQGQSSVKMNMITYDDFQIPLTATIKRVNLHPFEIIPGETLCDFLEVRVLEANLKLLDNINSQRKIAPQDIIDRFKLDGFEYTIQAKQLLTKFYPHRL